MAWDRIPDSKMGEMRQGPSATTQTSCKQTGSQSAGVGHMLNVELSALITQVRHRRQPHSKSKTASLNKEMRTVYQ